MEIEKDRSFLLAERYVQETGVSVFLTGKAGTGKTTFLKSIVDSTVKRCAVVAPTGVAAINAGGVTIHSFFQLPLCPYLPEVKELITEYQMPEKKQMLRKERVHVLRSLDLLIIDEISMVRADILDAIDMVLRRYRRNDKPFGGVQLLMIGDVQQLPPVVTDSEKVFFDRVYPSPFFFYSKALQKLPYVVVELEKVHRQSDAAFLDLLNDIRQGNPSQASLTLLNSRLDPSFQPPEGEKWIRLTTHNYQADSVNKARMDALDGEESSYDAHVDGEFPESAYPADTSLTLKIGAQVMFIRNDTSGDARYYNGKLGVVTALEPTIVVTDDAAVEIEVYREEWQNLKYELNPSSGEIEGMVEGVFSQFPLRLAWAVTIHKSQGLTFDRVVIDAASAFSSGQVYVALSRCRTLEGIVLTSPISAQCAFASREVCSYEASYTPFDAARAVLEDHVRNYRIQMMCEAFDLGRLRYLYNRVNRIYQTELINTYTDQARAFAQLTLALPAGPGLTAMADTASKFQMQLRRIDAAGDADAEAKLRARAASAAEYFGLHLQAFASAVMPLMLVDIDNSAVKKQFKERGMEFLRELRLRLRTFNGIQLDGYSQSAFQKLLIDEEVSTESTMKVLVNSIKRIASVTEDESDDAEKRIYTNNRHPEAVKLLQEWRTEKYKALGVPAYVVLSQSALLGIADALPTTKAEFLKVKGFGKKKWEQYGEELIEVLWPYSKLLQI